MIFLSRTIEYDFIEFDKSRRCFGVVVCVVLFVLKDECVRGVDNFM